MGARIAGLALAAAVAVAGAAPAQTPTPAVQARDAETLKRFPPPGRMVDVGGRRLHILCKGPARRPVVVIEGGGMASSLYYGAAQAAVAKVARVCVYDRAGLGWSDPAPYPRTLEARADDLHALLRAAGIRGPHILAGHSMGGLVVRIYARKHPKDVAGVILVESSEEQFNGTELAVTRTAANARMMGLAVTAAANGTDIPQLRVPNGPPEQAVALRASVFRAGQDDMEAMSKLPQELSGPRVLGDLGDIPLVAIRRGRPDPGMSAQMNADWIAAQARVAALSRRSVAMVAAASGHNVHADAPGLYATAVQAILEMRGKR